MDNYKNAVEIAKNIYWVGKSEHEGMLHCNPYLIVDGDEAVLMDPGSPLDFEEVYRKVTEVVSLDQIKYVVLHHQDPDLCASVPLFEAAGANFKIVTHRWTQTLVKYYGIKSEYYILNDYSNKLTLKSGRELFFIETPYLHFSGSVVTYDVTSKILFSSDLFGAYSRKWQLYADSNYLGKMKEFNEQYMPSQETLKPVMDVFDLMDISMIAPQHGSIILDDVKKYIKVLKDLECGLHLTDYTRSQAKEAGYIQIINEIIHRYIALFGADEVYEILEDLDIKIALDAMEIISHSYKDNELWHEFFDVVYSKKGIEWIAVLETMVRKFSLDYGLPLPNVYQQIIQKIEIQAAGFVNQISKLQVENNHLNSAIRETEEKLLRCPITGLYNDNYFIEYMRVQIQHAIIENQENHYAVIMISLDNLAKIKYLYGDKEVDEVLRNTAYLLQELQMEHSMLFRLQGAMFAINLTGRNKAEAVIIAETLRNNFSEFEGFIEKLTVSIGVVSMDEIHGKNRTESPEKKIYEIAQIRVGLAKRTGMNNVCSESNFELGQYKVGKVLIADTDRVNVDFLKNHLEDNNFKVFIADNGLEALEIAQIEKPEIVICDVMLPQMDGFYLREKLMDQSMTKNIVFIVLSHLKNEDSVKRAIELEIDYYFKKPYMISEIIGIVKNKMKSVVL